MLLPHAVIPVIPGLVACGNSFPRSASPPLIRLNLRFWNFPAISKELNLKTAFGSTKDTKRHENLKRYNKTVIHQTGHTMML